MGRPVYLLRMSVMSGLVNCSNCGSAWSKPVGVNFGRIKITRCPNCSPEMQTEEDTSPEPLSPLPWAIPPAPAKSDLDQLRDVIAGITDEAHARLEGEPLSIRDGLKAVVEAAEKNWELDDRIDLASRVWAEEERRRRRGK